MLIDSLPVPVSFAGLTTLGRVPHWAPERVPHWEPRRATVEQLCRENSLAGVLVVSTSGLPEMTRERNRIGALVEHVLKADYPVRVILNFQKGGHTPDELVESCKFFRAAISRLEVADGDEMLEKSLNEAVAKYLVENEAWRPDALAEVSEIIAITHSLLSDRGRLSAKAVAEVLGIPWTRLAVLLGSTKQAVGKTPDAPALQAPLRPYERIARLRAVLPEKGLLAWMQRPNMHLEDQTPRQIIEMGRAEVVADLVESMLTGTST